MTKEQFNNMMDKLHSMSYKEAEKMAVEVFKESGIKYTYNNEGIKFDGLIQNNIIPDELREQMKTAYDWLELANDIVVDYDGYRDSESLMGLIDEMKSYVVEAMKCIINGDYK